MYTCIIIDHLIQIPIDICPFCSPIAVSTVQSNVYRPDCGPILSTCVQSNVQCDCIVSTIIEVHLSKFDGSVQCLPARLWSNFIDMCPKQHTMCLYRIDHKLRSNPSKYYVLSTRWRSTSRNMIHTYVQIPCYRSMGSIILNAYIIDLNEVHVAYLPS